MKTYSVCFTEPVCRKYIDDRWNKTTKKWEYDVECEEWSTSFELYSLKEAKKLINANLDKYKGSCITKTWSNGDWENLGPIKMKGSNKHFIANAKQKVANY